MLNNDLLLKQNYFTNLYWCWWVQNISIFFIFIQVIVDRLETSLKLFLIDLHIILVQKRRTCLSPLIVLQNGQNLISLFLFR